MKFIELENNLINLDNVTSICKSHEELIRIYFNGRNFTEDMAIEALEKQIPEIPDYEGDGYADGELVYDTWICPRCGRHYEIDYDHYVYCPECGQLIDWSTLE